MYTWFAIVLFENLEKGEEALKTNKLKLKDQIDLNTTDFE